MTTLAKTSLVTLKLFPANVWLLPRKVFTTAGVGRRSLAKKKGLNSDFKWLKQESFDSATGESVHSIHLASRPAGDLLQAYRVKKLHNLQRAKLLDQRLRQPKCESKSNFKLKA